MLALMFSTALLIFMLLIGYSSLSTKKSWTPSRFGEHVPGIAEVYAWILNARAPMISELSAIGPNWKFTVFG